MNTWSYTCSGDNFCEGWSCVIQNPYWVSGKYVKVKETDNKRLYSQLLENCLTYGMKEREGKMHGLQTFVFFL